MRPESEPILARPTRRLQGRLAPVGRLHHPSAPASTSPCPSADPSTSSSAERGIGMPTPRTQRAPRGDRQARTALAIDRSGSACRGRGGHGDLDHARLGRRRGQVRLAARSHRLDLRLRGVGLPDGTLRVDARQRIDGRAADRAARPRRDRRGLRVMILRGHRFCLPDRATPVVSPMRWEKTRTRQGPVWPAWAGEKTPRARGLRRCQAGRRIRSALSRDRITSRNDRPCGPVGEPARAGAR